MAVDGTHIEIYYVAAGFTLSIVLFTLRMLLP